MRETVRSVERLKSRAVETGVYLPLGVYSAAAEKMSKLSRPKLRRFYADLVGRGHDRLAPVARLARKAAPTADTLEAAGARVRDAGKAAATARKPQARPRKAPPKAAPRVRRAAAPQHARELPIEDYAAKTASEIAAESKGLTQTELAHVHEYERAHENRSTVVEAVERRLVTLPIRDYDSLTADQIVERLEALPADDLKFVRSYETQTKNRVTVVDKIDSLT